jgi:CheY-like chemotaxis protein
MKPTVVGGAEKALDVLEEAKALGTPFPLALVDAQMPDIDGFHLAEKINQHNLRTTSLIVMLTSTDLHTGAARCRELGIGTYLAKPVKESELMRAIKTALGYDNNDAEKQSIVTGLGGPAIQRQLRILVAEDNPVNQTLVVRLLEKKGHAVTIAETGRTTLERVKKEPFDLILMDIQMPEIDGLEVTATIRQHEKMSSGRHIPIIAMTAHAMVGDRDRCLHAGMDYYLSKPLDPKQLFAAIELCSSSTEPFHN